MTKSKLSETMTSSLPRSHRAWTTWLIPVIGGVDLMKLTSFSSFGPTTGSEGSLKTKSGSGTMLTPIPSGKSSSPSTNVPSKSKNTRFGALQRLLLASPENHFRKKFQTHILEANSRTLLPKISEYNKVMSACKTIVYFLSAKPKFSWSYTNEGVKTLSELLCWKNPTGRKAVTVRLLLLAYSNFTVSSKTQLSSSHLKVGAIFNPKLT